MNKTVKEVLEVIEALDIDLLFKPRGLVVYGDGTKASEVDTLIYFDSGMDIEIIEYETEYSSVTRNYEGGLEDIPEQIQNRIVKSIEEVKANLSTSSSGKTVYQSVSIKLEIE